MDFAQTKWGMPLTSLDIGAEGAMRQFRIGEVVTCIPHMFPRSAAPGNYKIIAAMPDRDGDRMYRIKSPLEEHERVVGENLLVRSEGYLPEEASAQSSRRGSITLPTLKEFLQVQQQDEACSWSIASVPEQFAESDRA